MSDAWDSKRITWGAPHTERDFGQTFLTVLADGADALETEVSPAGAPERTDPDPLPRRVADRYQLQDLLGRGGMGEVWRVWDEVLRRTVAMKVLQAKLLNDEALAGFREEAQVAAQLQHPGIIPVHDLGTLPDRRLWFTMKEVQGQTLEGTLQEVHRSWRLGYETTQGGFTFRRLLEAFLRVCETVAYAHARGVVHRDLKPSNIMLGEYGEVLVLDWGLARVVGAGAKGASSDPVDVMGSGSSGKAAITGTPAYMSPEQAQGRSAEAGPRADVYALGATLYDLLCERPPRLAPTVRRLVEMVAEGTPIQPPSQLAEGPQVDEELDRICMKALAQEEAERYPDASGLAAELAAWLDGARKRERAMVLVKEADDLLDASERAEVGAIVLEAQAARTLAPVARNAPAEEKLAAWRIEDQAREARRESEESRTRAVQLLRSALTHAPDLPEAHERLAAHFRRHHARLEADGRAADARAAEADLRAHDRAGAHANYLAGTGAVTLITDPPGAEVRVHRFVDKERRLQPVFERVLGKTPLVEAPLPMGSYLLTLHLPGHAEVRYPVQIGRLEHWDGVPPEASQPQPIRLPREGELGPDDLYVPAGWFWSGDDDWDVTLPLLRLWADGFVIRRFPVTVGEYTTYLNALLQAGGEDEAEAAQPLQTGGSPLFGRDAQGRFTGIRTDVDTPGWDAIPKTPFAPVSGVDWHQARAYAAWLAEREGAPWRLLMEREWQKAARGVDGRAYPWGDHFEPSWCRMRLTDQIPMFVDVREYPVDCSPYGARGMAGNVGDWVADPAPFPPEQEASLRVVVGSFEGPRRLAVGGSCGAGVSNCGTTARSTLTPGFRAAKCGFRLGRIFL